MADKPADKASVTPLVAPPPQGGHKNATIGPATGKLLPDWRRDRDYENAMPLAHM